MRIRRRQIAGGRPLLFGPHPDVILGGVLKEKENTTKGV
jgi:hypothetical protein